MIFKTSLIRFFLLFFALCHFKLKDKIQNKKKT
eukprot:UN25298